MTLAGLYSVAGLQGVGWKCVDAAAGSICGFLNLKGEIMTQEHVMLYAVLLVEMYSKRALFCIEWIG